MGHRAHETGGGPGPGQGGLRRENPGGGKGQADHRPGTYPFFRAGAQSQDRGGDSGGMDGLPGHGAEAPGGPPGGGRRDGPKGSPASLSHLPPLPCPGGEPALPSGSSPHPSALKPFSDLGPGGEGRARPPRQTGAAGPPGQPQGNSPPKRTSPRAPRNPEPG